MTSPPPGDQSAVFALLADPATHGLSEPVKRIDTHGAAVFLAGPDAYKVKRAVRFPYMDFSTLEKRRAACQAEIAVNQAIAPELYLGTIPVTRDADGLHLGGEGEIVEWAVHLRRFDENATLDRIAERDGALGPALIDRLARVIVEAHERAPRRESASATPALRDVLKETLEELRDSPDLFPRDGVAALGERLTRAFELAEPLLRERERQGQVRRCHGDLHLRNIVLIDARPVLFDAIEFDEAIATTDILYDLAFLLMDLCRRGLRAEAARLLNRYLWSSPAEEVQIEGLSLLPLFLGLRAAIRAKVAATQFRQGSPNLGDEARSYAEAAARFFDAIPPVLVAVGGLSGTGKSTLASAMAPSLGSAPGAFHLRSDIERKRLFGADDDVRLPAEAYRPEVTADVYRVLERLAGTGLRARRCVIADATFREPAERQAIEALAARAGVPFVGLWLEAPLELLRKRVAERRGDASDATAEMVERQINADPRTVSWQRLDASVSVAELTSAALAAVRSSGN